MARPVENVVTGETREYSDPPWIALRGTEAVGALSVNAAKDMAMFRRIIAANAKPCRADLKSRAYAGCFEMTARKCLREGPQ